MKSKQTQPNADSELNAGRILFSTSALRLSGLGEMMISILSLLLQSTSLIDCMSRARLPGKTNEILSRFLLARGGCFSRRIRVKLREVKMVGAIDSLDEAFVRVVAAREDVGL